MNKLFTKTTENPDKGWKYQYRSIKILLMLLGIFTLTFAVSCSKDDDDNSVIYPEENPLAKYYEQTGFNIINPVVDDFSYEFGLAFSSNVKGKINALTVRIPDANPNLRVTIWDYDAQTVLRTETVNVESANTEVTKSIENLPLEKDKKYLITMNSNDWYYSSRSNESVAAYPITAGNIVFYEFRSKFGDAQTFPNLVNYDYNAGDLSFVFQQTD